jgi:hypothetical protein
MSPPPPPPPVHHHHKPSTYLKLPVSVSSTTLAVMKKHMENGKQHFY